jgi:hypothetical protein
MSAATFVHSAQMWGHTQYCCMLVCWLCKAKSGLLLWMVHGGKHLWGGG